ncbi:MAG: DEAD/DEAH box helicase family protein [Solobacterium sp.]|nr:DEAD/DEAH box helicase family protein [Solobacterium sp.]
MQCPRCLNTNKEFFYHGSRGWYCRKCISFGRRMLEEICEPISLSTSTDGSEEYIMKYPLTRAQKEISKTCASFIKEMDVLLFCVCGAGKTELVLESIHQCLKQKKKVCFAIPRRQVVLELQQRLSSYFPNAIVVAVCGGYTDITDGDLIVCTTHQLYRYYQAFDLLILDEPDAYPFKGNPVLHGIAKTSCKGHIIYLTATPDQQLLKAVERKEIACLTLNERPHGHPLPVPVISIHTRFGMFIRLIQFLKKNQYKRIIVFVPTIRMANLLGDILKVMMDVSICTSKTANRDQIIERYRRKKSGVMIATTVLERGVTIPGVIICVYYAEHYVFDLSAQTQMAGRAGRTFEEPTGEVLFIQNERSAISEKCIAMIKEANQGCVA